VSGDRTSTDQSINQIARNIKGMIFLGTPFRGSAVAGWGDVIRKVFNVVKTTDKNILKSLKPDSQELKDLRKGFPDIIRKRNDTAQRIGVVFFYEEKDTFGVKVSFSRRACPQLH
jgi:hypothetical protein